MPLSARRITVIGMKIAVQTKCLAQPLKQALHTAGQVQADGVQIDLRQELRPAELSDTALRQVRKILDDLNLRVGTTAFPTRRGFANADDLDRRIEAAVEAMRASSRLNARVILLSMGPLPDPESSATSEPFRVARPESSKGAASRATLVEALTALATQANRHGVQLALQCPTAHPADLKALIEELPEGLVGADLSPADLILNAQDPRDYAETLGPDVLHVFANDAVRGLGGAAGNDVELGRGTADFPELLGLLEEHNYRGWITVERRNSRRPAEDIASTIQFLRSL
jgi:sugar phosphate isomerase/epimerase